MSRIQRIGSLEIEIEAKKPHTYFYIIQLFSLCIMVLVILAGILGLFGNGILSHIEVFTHDLTVNYEKFVRTEATNLFHIQIRHLTQNSVKLHFSYSLLKNVSIKTIAPTPSMQMIEGDGISYFFNQAYSNQILNITYIFEPESFGKLQGRISLNNDEGVEISQFIYP